MDNNDNIVIASYKTIEFYTLSGEFIKSIKDDYIKGHQVHRVKGFQHVRKDVAFGSNEEIYVADANTNSVRGVRFYLPLYSGCVAEFLGQAFMNYRLCNNWSVLQFKCKRSSIFNETCLLSCS